MDNKFVEIVYEGIEKNEDYEKIINIVMNKCFEVENLEDINLYMCITLTNPKTIRSLNNTFRKIDKETDVLSFPMFEKEELDNMIKSGKNQILEPMGDIIISIERVREQAEEYGHSFERELAYMVVHGFYHVIGYDHIMEEDKVIMRSKEEKVLNMLNINR